MSGPHHPQEGGEAPRGALVVVITLVLSILVGLAAMVVFGLSGIVLFLVPRLRRRQNRRRMRAAEAC